MRFSAGTTALALLLGLTLLSGCSSQQEADGVDGAVSSSPTSPEGSPDGADTAWPDQLGQGVRSPAARPDIDSADSLTVLVNKARPLDPLTYEPADLVAFGPVQLREEAAQAAEQMFAQARNEGVEISALSGYRSYQTQVETYNSWVSAYGREQADVASARPGYSEHQTGLALDIGTGGACDLQVCFRDTETAHWVAEHGPDYGFVLRYPWWHHETTGYWYEPWHLRYVGLEEAAALKESGLATLEELWGSGPAPDYLR